MGIRLRPSLYLILFLILGLCLSGCGVFEGAGQYLFESLKSVYTSSDGNTTAIHPEIIQKAREITGTETGEYEKLLRIYKWVTNHISYDMEKFHAGIPYTLDALQTLQTQKGICGDYAKLTEELLLAAGIEASLKSGYVATDNDPELHAWNEAVAEGMIYALDTTWGAGFLNEDRTQFIRRPSMLFLTTPEELERLHQNRDYVQEQTKKLRREEALSATPYFVGGFEEQLLNLLNNHRPANNTLKNLEKLHVEARSLAETSAEKELKGEPFPLDLKATLDTLNLTSPFISRLAVNIYYYWSYTSPDVGEIQRMIMSDSGGTNNMLSPVFNTAGVAVVKRGELYVICQLLGKAE